ncbi:hypothetical protein J6590_041533 [Homalodisca vitripennis]|nr:hypothetical protein J6590_041533 [Homalodisca vitripennis]
MNPPQYPKGKKKPIDWYHVAGDFTLSYIAGAVLYLTVEGPCSNITNWCFQGEKKTKEVIENKTERFVFKNPT